MRRGFAMLLVVLFSFSLIAPAVFAADAGSRLPACCRRGGAHGCAMSSPSGPASGPAAQAARCRYFPPTKAVQGRTISLPGVSHVISVGLVSHPAPRPLTEALYRISYSRASRQRGPPMPLW